MHHLLRNALALIAVIWLVTPVPGDEGGENNGGTGVWILPACANITATSTDPAAGARAVMVAPSTAADIRLRVDDNLGAAVATFTDDLSGSTVGLQVSGRVVTLSKQLLQALQQSPLQKGTLLIVDAAQRGYVIRVSIVQSGQVRLSIL